MICICHVLALLALLAQEKIGDTTAERKAFVSLHMNREMHWCQWGVFCEAAVVTLSKAAFQYKGANQEVNLPDIVHTLASAKKNFCR